MNSGEDRNLARTNRRNGHDEDIGLEAAALAGIIAGIVFMMLEIAMVAFIQQQSRRRAPQVSAGREQRDQCRGATSASTEIDHATQREAAFSLI